MGVVVSIFGQNTGRTDDPDPVTGLTSREKYLVTTTWREIRKKPTESGVKLLTLLFEKHPDYLQLFPFKDIPLKELPENKRFQAHCNSVVYALSSVVDGINESELLVTMLLKVGETHKPRRVSEQAFLDLKTVMLDFFGTFMTKPEIDAWKKTADVAFATMLQGLNANK